jgi:hypothetical protein
MIKRSRPHSTGYGHRAPQFPRKPPAGGCLIIALAMVGGSLALSMAAAAVRVLAA